MQVSMKQSTVGTAPARASRASLKVSAVAHPDVSERVVVNGRPKVGPLVCQHRHSSIPEPGPIPQIHSV